MATAMAEAGKAVGVLDLDPQGSATNWINHQAARNLRNRLAHCTSNLSLYNAKSKFDYVFVDTMPLVKPTDRMRKEAKAAKTILLLASDSPMDLHATKLTVKNLLTTAALKRKTRLLFVRVVKGTKLSERLDEMAKLVGIPRVKPVIYFSNGYRRAAIEGLSALTSKAKSDIRDAIIATI
jgi:cellulose biosynthesis protein BcsQ|tara:strand:- start:644 stop:1183 length:540 start_codon:yes stop_codon:yes gene_type:complete